MMRRLIIAGMFVAGVAAPVAAQTYDGCTDSENIMIKDAMRSAKEVTLQASVAVGDTPEYTRWFGTYSDQNAERVRASLKSIVTAIRGGAVTAQCQRVAADGCAAGEYAYVYADEPYLLYLCPSFFNLPPLEALRPGARRSNNGTRAGTIVHEVSHFLHVASTDDNCYSRDICADMARTDAQSAIENADSYQYYAEDVVYFARQPIANKPPPAPRVDR